LPRPEPSTIPAAGFYTVADSNFFPGVVALLNSLRVVGHEEPLFVLDCGLDRAQREMLAPHATLVSAPSGAHPVMLKWRAPLTHPAQVMVLLDADMIITRPLNDLLEGAAAGRIVAFESGVDRFFPEWGDLLGLGTSQRHRYLNAGAVAVSRGVGMELLELLRDGLSKVDVNRGWYSVLEPSYPFWLLEQDVLNAVLSARFADRLAPLELRLAATFPFEGVDLVDEATLRCAHQDGVEPYLLHHIWHKPWLTVTPENVYSRLLTRLLVNSDVALRLPKHVRPLRLRGGLLASLERKRVGLQGRRAHAKRMEDRQRILARLSVG